MAYKRFHYLLLLYLLFHNIGFAQESYNIMGKVVETDTNEPIAAAQVFLNGTTIGVSSDKDGNFTLEKIPTGVYELAVRFIGFEQKIIEINTNTLKDFYTISLNEKIFEMDEIVVKPNLKTWKADFEVFRNSFIGKGPFADNTEILNKEVLNFYFNTDRNVFEAYAHIALEIKNDDLGYKIYYYLENFEIDFNYQITTYSGLTQFEELKSNRKKTKNRWTKNRELAYLGSFDHFIKELVGGNLAEEGYQIRKEKRDEKSRYVDKNEAQLTSFLNKVDAQFYKLQFQDFLHITYINELEDETYLKAIANPFDNSPRTMIDFQTSSITLTQEYVLIDTTGYIHNPTAVLSDGYWGFEKLSDLLPLNYTIKK